MNQQNDEGEPLSEIQRLRALILVAGLADIQPASKDSLTHHGISFAKSLRDYRADVGAETERAIARGGYIDLDTTREASDRYELAAMLYAPGLIGALARAVVELAKADG